MPKRNNQILWNPKYEITPEAARCLMQIEAVRTVVTQTPFSPSVEAELRHEARIRSTHYSTRIEGNRLTLEQAAEVISNKKTSFHGRERDVREVQNYWDALLQVEKWAAAGKPFTEDVIKRVHGIIERGKRAKPSPYRKVQNVIRDAASGAIVYMPPEPKDVSGLMDGLASWVKQAEKNGVPVPLVAALVHYQFVTIHPYMDGNGRTGRLLATFILHRGGYDLNGFFSLEEHHARDLEGYYEALASHPHHNYYEGRADVDLSSWVTYFLKTLAGVFEEIRDRALKAVKTPAQEPKALRTLDRRARVVLGLFAKKEQISSGDVAKALGLSKRMSRILLNEWVDSGLLKIKNPSRKKRSYEITAKYRQFIGNKAEK